MKTDLVVEKYLSHCEDLGKSENTVRQYAGYLRRFVEEFPELPLDNTTIEFYLKMKRETPGHRGRHYKILQALYSYLQRHEGIKSPVPGKKRRGGLSGLRGSIPSVDGPGPQRMSQAARQAAIPGLPPQEFYPVDTLSAVQRYMSFKGAEGVSARTQEQYRSRLFPFAKVYPVVPTDPDEIARFLSTLQVDPVTRWDYRKHIIAFYHFLERRREVPEVTNLFPRIKAHRKVRRVLSPEELGRLFAMAQDYEDRAILTLLVDSKIRASELCGLTREDVYPDHIVVTGKTGQRSVPIKQETADMIGRLASQGPLFKVRGRPMTRAVLRQRVRDLMLRSGLDGKKLGPHILRHSSSVQHIMFGGDLLSLKEELGHSTTRMTEQYAALAFKDVKEKHEQVDVLGRLSKKDHREVK